MLKLTGKHNEAIIYAKAIEGECENQILPYLDHPLFADTKVRIMPDVHVGKGVVVGFTATCNEYVVPAIIGVDIGCGVNAYNLGKGNTPFDKLDKYIRKSIPAGKEVHKEEHPLLEEAFAYLNDSPMDFKEFKTRISGLCKKLHLPAGRVFAALGTLGGGNHFIEIDKDEDKNRWLLIHTGSRNLGLQVAVYHQDLAVSRTHADSPVKFLTGPAAEEYQQDMMLAQLYARLNRGMIGFLIGCDYFKIAHSKLENIESIHNYIDFDQGVIRKGAIAAHKAQQVVIPFSMADGAIIGTGLGNEEWNCSAPHGSGRKLSRTQAKSLSLDEYRKRMKNIWSSCVGKATLDESPMAYKKTADILEMLAGTVEIQRRLMPLYNFKADK